jgi:serine/threonine protein kinase
VKLLSVKDVKKLYGFKFAVKAADGGQLLIRIPTDQPAGWPKKGAEAWGLVAEIDAVRNGSTVTTKAFLKLFLFDVPEREGRTASLISRGFAKKHEQFHGVPFGWIGQINHEGVTASAHFTHMINGPFGGYPEDFRRLRESKRWNYTTKQRRRFAAELAATIAGLEAAKIVHGDISSRNILVGTSSDGAERCLLCDYDGFFHETTSRLPRRSNGLSIRPLGSAGYQYPGLIQEIRNDKDGTDDIYVATDRYALAIAICELMIWSEAVEEVMGSLGRDQLFDDESAMARSFGDLPQEIIDLFPEGFQMLKRALEAPSPTLMPSPEEWLGVLGFEVKKKFTGPPHIRLFEANGSSRIHKDTFKIVSKESSLSKIDKSLKDGKLVYDGEHLQMYYGKAALKRKRNGRTTNVTSPTGFIEIHPNDTIHVNGKQIEFYEADLIFNNSQ